MHQHILAAFGGTHEVHLAIEEAAALAHVFSGRVRVIQAIDSPAMPESHEVYSVDKLHEETHRTASASLVESQRQFNADGTPAEAGVLALNATDDDIGSALEHEAERWQAGTIVVGLQGKYGFACLLLGSVAERVTRLLHRTVIVMRAQRPQYAVD